MNNRRTFSALAAGAMLLGASAAFAVAPTVTAFTLPANGFSPLSVTAFTATDPDGQVNGYMITTTSTKPTATAPGWTFPAPTTYTPATLGALTLYGWARDNSNTVSSPKIATTTVLAAHSHDALYQKKYAQVVVVAKDGGNFSNPAEAVNSISDASPDKPYLVKIMPGVYNLDPDQSVQMKAYVDIEGSGRNVTRITGQNTFTGNNSPGVIKGAVGAQLRSITVKASNGIAVNQPWRMDDVEIDNSAEPGWAIWLSQFDNAEIEHSVVTGAPAIAAAGGNSLLVSDSIIAGYADHPGTGVSTSNIGLLTVRDTQITAVTGIQFGPTTFGTAKADILNCSLKTYPGSWSGYSFYFGSGVDAVLRNVEVDTSGASLVQALSAPTDSNVSIFQGRFLGDVSFKGAALGVQFTGNLPPQSEARLVNCVDTSFAPIIQ